MASILMLLLALTVSLFAGTAEAITNGSPDGNNHPYVCLVVFDVETDGGIEPMWRNRYSSFTYSGFDCWARN